MDKELKKIVARAELQKLENLWVIEHMHFHERIHVGARQPLNVRGQVCRPQGDDPVRISFRDYDISIRG